MKERFGNTTRGLPRVGGASGDSKLRHHVHISGMTKKQGLLETSTWEETVFLSRDQS